VVPACSFSEGPPFLLGPTRSRTPRIGQVSDLTDPKWRRAGRTRPPPFLFFFFPLFLLANLEGDQLDARNLLNARVTAPSVKLFPMARPTCSPSFPFFPFFS